MKRTTMVIWSWASATLMPGNPGLGNADDYKGEGKEVLSDGGTTITWTIPTSGTG